ncbi:unnamed protein product [marine sediment metagenome]|uniref:Uncharacterized protein n=1 Tax=marine sediment metagenome TaxID=412755 RepID=X1HKK2_9ZZZZ
MKLDEIKAGEIFCIKGSKTYPKLRLDVGYVDIRNMIRSVHDLKNYDCELMSEGAIAEEFRKYGMTMDDVKNLKRKLSAKFN